MRYPDGGSTHGLESHLLELQWKGERRETFDFDCATVSAFREREERKATGYTPAAVQNGKESFGRAKIIIEMSGTLLVVRFPEN